MRLSRAHHEELGVVEPFWQAQLAVFATLVLYVALPSRLTVGPNWLLPALEAVLLVGLAVSTPYRHHTQSPMRRRASIGLVAIVTVANFTALGLLVHLLFEPNSAAGRNLIVSAPCLLTARSSAELKRPQKGPPDAPRFNRRTQATET